MEDNAKKVSDFITSMNKGANTGKILRLNSKTGKLETVSPTNYNAKDSIEITAEEARMFTETAVPSLLIFKEDLDDVLNLCKTDDSKPALIPFQSVDDSEIFRFSKNGDTDAYLYDITESIVSEKQVLDSCFCGKECIFLFYNRKDQKVTAYLRKDAVCLAMNIIIPPVKEEIYSRIKGIYETDILADKTVMIVGLGSGGSPIALELVKQGVQNLILIDHDRLETANISRHICGINDLGRYKTKAVTDMLKNKNPYAAIITYEMDIGSISPDLQKHIFQNIDLVICCTDNRESRLITNRLCLEYNIPCIYGGAFQRAYGGQVLKVIPHKTLCYQCFISQLRELAEDCEVSNRRESLKIAYSDVDVPIEPGLSTDVAPISNFMSKLAILELLKDCDHTLTSLYEDLDDSLYLWFNRREENTRWQGLLKPMSASVDSMSILRWYGVSTEKNESCTACGRISPFCGDDLAEEEISLFAPT